MPMTLMDQYGMMGAAPKPFDLGDYPQAIRNVERGNATFQQKNPNAGLLGPLGGVAAAIMHGVDQAASARAMRFLQKESDAQKSRAQFYEDALFRASDPRLTPEARYEIMGTVQDVLRGHAHEASKGTPKEGHGAIVGNIFKQIAGGDMKPADKIDPETAAGQIAQISTRPESTREHWKEKANEEFAKALGPITERSLLTEGSVQAKAFKVAQDLNLASRLGEDGAKSWLQGAVGSVEAYPMASKPWYSQQFREMSRQLGAAEEAPAPVDGVSPPPSQQPEGSPLSQQYLKDRKSVV